MNNLMNSGSIVYLLSILIFIVVLLVFEGAYLLWTGLQAGNSVKVNRRLRALSAGGIDTKEAMSLLHIKHMSSMPALNRFLNSIPRMHAIDRNLEQAGIDLSVMRFIGLQIILVVMLYIATYALLKTSIIITTLLALIIGIGLPWTIVNIKKRQRTEKFSAQLPATLDFIARSLRAGNPFLSAIKSVSKETPEPTASEFGITFDELNYGLDLNTALHNLEERSGSEEIRFFITAVLIQQKTGGNLADVLNKLSTVMRARVNTLREVRVLAAEMKYSAYVLIGLPFFVAGALMITNPEYLSILFTHELGWVIIGIQIGLMAVGYIIVQRMINFRV